MTLFRFDEAAHEYRLDGVVEPGVTRVLQDQGIVRHHPRTDPFYIDRGQAVHLAMHLALLSDLDESTVDEHARLYVDRGLAALERIHFRPIVLELPLWCSITRTGGKPDALGECDLGLMLADWKVGEHQPGYDVQAVQYLSMLRQAARRGELPVSESDLQRVTVAILPLNADRPTWHYVQDQRAALDTYRAAVLTWKWRRANGVL